MSVRILIGDALEVLQTLPDSSVQCCVSSPPYFGLRDYGVEGQIGLEETPEEFIAKLTAVFRQTRRVLRGDGTMWIIIGDTANNRRRIRTTSHQPSLNDFREQSWAEATKAGLTRLSITSNGLKEKDMFGIPWMLAVALRTDGWFLRQEIIWSKNFGKPEPTKDRLPSRHEQIFLFSKSKTYQFNRDDLPAFASGSVWEVSPVGRSDHGATFAAGIAEACIIAGSSRGDTVLDPFAGSGTVGVVAQMLGRKSILCELNPEFAKIAEDRTKFEFDEWRL